MSMISIAPAGCASSLAALVLLLVLLCVCCVRARSVVNCGLEGWGLGVVSWVVVWCVS